MSTGRTLTAEQQADRRGHRALLVLACAGLVVGLLALAQHRWTSPTLLEESGTGFAGDAQPLADFPLYVGLSAPAEAADRETLTIRGHRAHFSENTARATAGLAACTLREDQPDIVALGTVMGTTQARATCSSLRPVRRGTEVRHGGDRGEAEQLVLVVTPTRPGTARVTSVDVDYARGWQHLGQRGTQRLGLGLDVSVTATR